MSNTYEEIVSAVKKLSVSEQENLVRSITTELMKKKSRSKKDLKSILMKAPDWSDADYENYQKARTHINNSRLS